MLSKGAPEVMQGLLAEVPPHYQQCYKVRWQSAAPCGCLGFVLAASSELPQWLPANSHPTANPAASPLPPKLMQHYASEGARVLALAYKQLDNLMTPSELRHLPRDSAESQLTFAGAAAVFTVCVLDGHSQPHQLPRSSGRRAANSFGRACFAATAVLHMCGLSACSHLFCLWRRAGLPQHVGSLVLALPHILPAPAGLVTPCFHAALALQGLPSSARRSRRRASPRCACCGRASTSWS